MIFWIKFFLRHFGIRNFLTISNPFSVIFVLRSVIWHFWTLVIFWHLHITENSDIFDVPLKCQNLSFRKDTHVGKLTWIQKFQKMTWVLFREKKSDLNHFRTILRTFLSIIIFGIDRDTCDLRKLLRNKTTSSASSLLLFDRLSVWTSDNDSSLSPESLSDILDFPAPFSTFKALFLNGGISFVR